MKIAVVGGGVVGLTSALRLARAGHRVTVLDAARALEAPSWNNAGHIAIEQVAPIASLATLRAVPRRLFVIGGALDLPRAQWATWLPFGMRLMSAARPGRFRRGTEALRALVVEALPAWRHLVDTIGAPELLSQDGHLLCWGDADSATRGRRAWREADIGNTSIGDASHDDERLLAMLTPNGAAGGIARFSGTAAVRDLTALAGALRRALHEAGGVSSVGKAQLTKVGGRANVEGLEADVVLVAAGIGSGALMRTLGHAAPVIAERGYHIRASAADWPEDAPPIVFEDRSMIVTRFRDQVQAAGFVEFTAPDAPPDPRKWERLEQHVLSLGLPMRAPFIRWMGARPTLPDYLPAIGRSRSCGNLFYAFGHQHLGLTLAPVTASVIASLIDGQRPVIDLSPFDLARFARRKERL